MPGAGWSPVSDQIAVDRRRVAMRLPARHWHPPAAPVHTLVGVVGASTTSRPGPIPRALPQEQTMASPSLSRAT